MRLLSAVFLLSLSATALHAAEANTVDPAKIAEYVKSLPNVTPPAYDEVQRLSLAANPLGCEDHPHAPGGGGPGGVGSGPAYLWQREGKPQIMEDYNRKRAFYGCLDWHSAVNSTWMMVSLLKSDPTIAVGPGIRLEFEQHLQKENLDGELDYFKNLRGPLADFEKPYGYAWLLKLYGEAKSWDDPEGRRMTLVLDPFAQYIKANYIAYLQSLNYPIRVGLHPNTALDMIFTLDYTNQTHDQATEKVIHDTAIRLFGKDTHCATAAEPVFADFASPCLAEAALMGRILDAPAYSKWLDTFFPPVYAPEFQVYANEIDAVHGNNRDTTGTDEEGLPNAHLVGLNYQRAADLIMIANGLPKDDPRVPAYRKLAGIAAKQGFDKIGSAGYLGTHWIATYALMYENLANITPATPPEKLHDKVAKH